MAAQPRIVRSPIWPRGRGEPRAAVESICETNAEAAILTQTRLSADWHCVIKRSAHYFRSGFDIDFDGRTARLKPGDPSQSVERKFDSYDYPQLIRELIEPFRSGTGQRFRRAIHNVETDEPVHDDPEEIREPSTLLVDGIFLHRDELVHHWDVSVFLDVDAATSVRRMALRVGSPTEIEDEANRRYVEGQQLYIESCNPSARATLVIDNTDLDFPRVISARGIEGDVRAP